MSNNVEKTDLEILSEEISRAKELVERQASVVKTLSDERNRLYSGIRSNPIIWEYYTKVTDSPLTDNNHALELIEYLVGEISKLRN